MPERLAYDEAIQVPSVRLKVADPELKKGRVEKVSYQTNVGIVERPWGQEGGFAIVYKFRTFSGQLRAIRCFRRKIHPEQQFRYQLIGPYFEAHASHITVKFRFHDPGLTVQEQGQPTRTVPIIEMDWIEGVTLLQKVDELCKKQDKAALQHLSEQFTLLYQHLQDTHIAHGDLAGENIMIREDGEMLLIDYDGVYIPDAAFHGRSQILKGQPGYQHPDVDHRPFDEHMDAFSALVIYTALLALSIRPELWQRYTQKSQDDQPLDINLLFTQEDFAEPQKSALFRELGKINDKRLKILHQELVKACSLPISQVRFPFQALDVSLFQKQALAHLHEAISKDDDALIIQCWTPRLANYPPAQSFLPRVQLAQKLMSLLTDWRNSIQSQDYTRILAAYDEQLDTCQSVTADERRLLALARRFEQVYKQFKQNYKSNHEQNNPDDDQQLLMLIDEIEQLPAPYRLIFSLPEQEQIENARLRQQGLQKIKEALQSRLIAQIAPINHHLTVLKNYLTDDEQQQIVQAFHLQQAYQSDDDTTISAAYDAVVQPTRFSFTSQERQRINLARRRLEALKKLRQAFPSKNIQQINASYNIILEYSKDLTPDERTLVTLIRQFVQALDEDNDDRLVKNYDSIQQSSYRLQLHFTLEEQARVTEARQRRTAWEHLQAAFADKNLRHLVETYDQYPLLATYPQITPEQRRDIELARIFLHHYDNQQDDLLLSAYNDIQSSMRTGACEFTPDEQQRIRAIQDRKAASLAFEEAIQQGNNARLIVDLYQHLPAHIQHSLTREQTQSLAQARDYLKSYQKLQEAIQKQNDKELRAIYQRLQTHPMLALTQQEYQYIETALKFEVVEQALKQEKYAEAIQLAKKVQGQNGDLRRSVRIELGYAVRKFIQQHELEEIAVGLYSDRNGHYLLSNWWWPRDELIRDAVILYSPNEQPPSYEELKDITCYYQYVIRRAHERQVSIRINLRQRYPSLYVRICCVLRDEWNEVLTKDDRVQLRHYLSKGVAGFVPLTRN